MCLSSIKDTVRRMEAFQQTVNTEPRNHLCSLENRSLTLLVIQQSRHPKVGGKSRVRITTILEMIMDFANHSSFMDKFRIWRVDLDIDSGSPRER